MKKNGFTLIELLAVIVILAIIALIATPIILGIINDAREESNERSVELYASAVRNGIAAYQLRTGNEVEPKTYKSSELDFVEYDGNVECDTVAIYADGKIYVADCEVNGTEVDYIYGEKQQIYKPQYYAWYLDGPVGEIEAPENLSTVPPTGKNWYLGFDVMNGKVATGYTCFTRNGNEYCLKGATSEAYEININIIKEAFKDVVDTNCRFNNQSSSCEVDGFAVEVSQNGRAVSYGVERINDDGTKDVTECGVYEDNYITYIEMNI